MKKINIFLASSSELEEERREIKSFYSKDFNKILPKKYCWEIIDWQELYQGNTTKRHQDFINEVMIKCPIVIILLYKTWGKYTEEEYKLACKLLQNEKEKPYCVYVFFKNAQGAENDKNNIPPEVKKLKEQIDNDETIYIDFQNIDNLKNKIIEELNKIKHKVLTKFSFFSFVVKTNFKRLKTLPVPTGLSNSDHPPENINIPAFKQTKAYQLDANTIKLNDTECDISFYYQIIEYTLDGQWKCLLETPELGFSTDIIETPEKITDCFLLMYNPTLNNLKKDSEDMIKFLNQETTKFEEPSSETIIRLVELIPENKYT